VVLGREVRESGLGSGVGRVDFPVRKGGNSLSPLLLYSLYARAFPIRLTAGGDTLSPFGGDTLSPLTGDTLSPLRGDTLSPGHPVPGPKTYTGPGLAVEVEVPTGAGPLPVADP